MSEQKELLEYLIRVSGTEETRAALQKVESELQNVGDKGEEAGDALTGLSDRVSGGIKNMIAGYATFQAVLGAVRDLLRSINEENAQAVAGVESFTKAVGQLSQLSLGDRRKTAELEKEVVKTMLQRGVGAQEAADLQFALRSLGLEKQRAFFAEFFGITDPTAIATAAKTLQTAFGEEMTGDVRAITNKLFAAAQESKVKAEQIAPEATIAGQAVKRQGGNDVEALATLGVLTNALKSARIAGTQIKAFADVLVSKGISGGILAGAEQIQAMGMTPQQLQEYLGSTEATSAFGAIQLNRNVILAAQARIAAAGATAHGPQDVSRLIQEDYRKGHGEIIELAKAKARNDLIKQGAFGSEEISEETLIAELEGASLLAGESRFTRWLRMRLARGADYLGFGESGIRRAFGAVDLFWESPMQGGGITINNIAAQYAPPQQDSTRGAPVNAVGVR